MNNNSTGGKVFFTCPICQMEQQISKKYGDVYFVSAPAAIFDFSDRVFALSVKSLLLRRNIRDVYFVCDPDCCFVQNVLNGTKLMGLHCEEVIRSLKTPGDDAIALSEKILKDQLDQFRNSSIFAGMLEKERIRTRGLVMSKDLSMLRIEL